MNLSQFKDPVSHMCLAGIILISIAGLTLILMTNNFVTEFAEFRENI